LGVACHNHRREDGTSGNEASVVQLRRAINRWASEAALRYGRVRAEADVRSARLGRGWGEWRCAQLRRMFGSIAEGRNTPSHTRTARHATSSLARTRSGSLEDGAPARASGIDGQCGVNMANVNRADFALACDIYAQAGSRRSPEHTPASEMISSRQCGAGNPQTHVIDPSRHGSLSHPSAAAIGRRHPLQLHPCALHLKRWHRRALAARHTVSLMLAGWRPRARAALSRWHRLSLLRPRLAHRALWGADRRCRRRAAAALQRWRHAAALRLRWGLRNMLLQRVWERRARQVLGAWWELIAAETRRESHMMSVAAEWEWAAARSRAFYRLRRIREYKIRRRQMATRHAQLLNLAAAAGAFERWAAPGRAVRAFGMAGVRWPQRRAVERWQRIVGWRQVERRMERHRKAWLVRRVWAGWRLWIDVHSR
jgi:hypothetical protein